MTTAVSKLANLRRPALLVRAAHLGLDAYDRGRALKRLLPEETSKTSTDIFALLFEREEVMDEARRTGVAAYSFARHIELLAALIVEARLSGTPSA